MVNNCLAAVCTLVIALGPISRSFAGAPHLRMPLVPRSQDLSNRSRIRFIDRLHPGRALLILARCSGLRRSFPSASFISSFSKAGA